ncbi:hypothetical protein K0T69_000877 [Staphylococcus pseudintermedius]|nr:hypothetical protein [Staphylococcus pseudintermedius]
MEEKKLVGIKANLKDGEIVDFPKLEQDSTIFFLNTMIKDLQNGIHFSIQGGENPRKIERENLKNIEISLN